MKPSGIILFFFIVSIFCFFTPYTALCLLSPPSSSPTIHNLHVRLSRKALSNYLNQHEKGANAIQVLDATKHLPNQEAIKREEPTNGSNEAEAELIYHIDYHGVSTHPGPNPKHGKP